MQTRSYPFHTGPPHASSEHDFSYVDSPLTSALHKPTATNAIATTTGSFASAASQTELGRSSELPKDGTELPANTKLPLFQSFQLSAQQEHSSSPPNTHINDNSTSQKENEREPLSSVPSVSSPSFSTLPSSSISSPQSLLSSYHLRRPNNNHNDYNSTINNNYHISKSMYPKFSIPSPLSTPGSSITTIPIIHAKAPPLMQTPNIFSPEHPDRRLFVDPLFDPHSPLRHPLPFPYEAYEYPRMSPYVRPPVRGYAQPLLFPDHLQRPGMFVPPIPRREDYVMYGRGGEPFGRRPDFGASFRCDLCNIRAGTEDQLMAHFKGKKHLARLEKPQGAASKKGSLKPLDGEGLSSPAAIAADSPVLPTHTQTAQETQPQQSADTDATAVLVADTALVANTAPVADAEPIADAAPVVAGANQLVTINTSAASDSSLNKEPPKETNEIGAVAETSLSTGTSAIPTTTITNTTTTPSAASHSKQTKSQQTKQRKSGGFPSVLSFPYPPQYYAPHPIPYYYRQPMYGANWGPFFPPPREASYPPAGFYSPYPIGPRRAGRSNPLLPAQPKRAPLKGCEVCNIPNFTSMQQLTAHMTGKKHIAKANPSPVAATAASTSPTATTATKAILARPQSNSDAPTNSMSLSSSSDFPDGASSELQATDDATQVHTVAVAPVETSQEAEC